MKLFNANAEPGDSVRLLACIPVKLEELPQEFKDYDTDKGRFELPRSGKYLLLIFEGRCGIFPTLRAAYPLTKIDYYKKAVGQWFELVIKKPAK